MTGDEDEPCLEPGIFMKRMIPTAGLLVIPKSGHTINIEEPDGSGCRWSGRTWRSKPPPAWPTKNHS